MSKVLLIGVKLIKAESIIEENVDDKVLSKVILNVQEIQLKGILGKELYDTVCNEVTLKVADSTYVIPEPVNEMLNDYIKPFLVHATVAEFIAINNYKVSNKGVQKLNDNSSSSINASEIEYLKNYYDNYVSTYKSNLIKFLKENDLIVKGADTNITLPTIGWFLDDGQRSASVSVSDNPKNEVDPAWAAQKGNYYTKTQVDGLFTSNIELETVTSITAMQSYVGTAESIYVTDARGGNFISSTAALVDDNGLVFPKSGGGHWVRQYDKSVGINPTWFSSLSTALTSIGSSDTSFVISDTITLSSNVVIPSNITLTIKKGGLIILGNFNLTINGSFEADRYKVFSTTGTGKVIFGTSSIDAQFPEWDGAYNDGTHAAETTAAFAKQVDRYIPIEIGIGTYLVDKIESSAVVPSNYRWPMHIKGQSRGGDTAYPYGQKSIIKTTATSNIAITIGANHQNFFSKLENFTLIGNGTNIGGISVGSSTTFAAFVSINNVTVTGFTGVGAYGINLHQCQEVDIFNCYIEGNYYGYYRPNSGYLTSGLIHGANSHIGNSTKHGFYCEGEIFGITFRDQLFEGNKEEGIYVNYQTTPSIIKLDNCYFEANCITGGTASIKIRGGVVSNRIVFSMINCEWHGNAGDVVKHCFDFDGVAGGLILNCTGFIPNRMITTANVQCHFQDNSYGSYSSGYDFRLHYGNLLGDISADDIDQNGDRFSVGTRKFNNLDLESSTIAKKLTFYDVGVNGGASISSTYQYSPGEFHITPLNSTAPTIFSGNGGVTVGPQTYQPAINGLTVKGNVGIKTTSAPTNALEVVGTIVGTSLKVTGGTVSQFLKANGTIDSSIYLTGNQNISITGDFTGSGTTAIAATLATVNSNVGTYGSTTMVPVLTVNGKGLVTGITTTTIPVYTLAGLGGISLTSISGTAPLSYNSGTGAFSIAAATNAVNGYLTSTDWNTFNDKISSQWTTLSSSIYFNTAGNVMIGTSTNDGVNKLQVIGSAKISGNITSTGSNFIVGTNAGKSLRTVDVTNTEVNSGVAWRITAGLTTEVGGSQIFFGNGNGARTPISGINSYMQINENFAPTSGTASYSMIELKNTFNQTGGANGITRSIYINPTLTATSDYRAIELTNNSGYGIYASGVVKNYFNGSLLIGSTTDDGVNKLQITGSLIATSIKKSGGLASQYLMADGSVATNASDITTITATTYTLLATDIGKVITFNNASAITVTVPSGLVVGFNCLILQIGAGQVTLSASGTTIQNRLGFTKTAGQYAALTLASYVSNVFVSSGDMV